MGLLRRWNGAVDTSRDHSGTGCGSAGGPVLTAAVSDGMLFSVSVPCTLGGVNGGISYRLPAGSGSVRVDHAEGRPNQVVQPGSLPPVRAVRPHVPGRPAELNPRECCWRTGPAAIGQWRPPAGTTGRNVARQMVGMAMGRVCLAVPVPGPCGAIGSLDGTSGVPGPGSVALRTSGRRCGVRHTSRPSRRRPAARRERDRTVAHRAVSGASPLSVGSAWPPAFSGAGTARRLASDRHWVDTVRRRVDLLGEERPPEPRSLAPPARTDRIRTHLAHPAGL